MDEVHSDDIDDNAGSQQNSQSSYYEPDDSPKKEADQMIVQPAEKEKSVDFAKNGIEDAEFGDNKKRNA